MGFNLLVAVGYNGLEDEHEVWWIEPSPRRTIEAWKTLFSRCQGTPHSIVSDDDKPIKRAIEQFFPRPGDQPPQHRICELHLRRRLENRVPYGILTDPNHPLTRALRFVFTSEYEWRKARAEALNAGLSAVDRWFHVNEQRLLPQICSRRDSGPNSTGAVEGVNQQLGDYLHKRAQTMTNLERARRLCALFMLGLNGKADERDWAERIRNYLIARAGHAPHQRPYDDPVGTWSLLS
jgi:hypothetical protein